MDSRTHLSPAIERYVDEYLQSRGASVESTSDSDALSEVADSQAVEVNAQAEEPPPTGDEVAASLVPRKRSSNSVDQDGKPDEKRARHTEERLESTAAVQGKVATKPTTEVDDNSECPNPSPPIPSLVL